MEKTCIQVASKVGIISTISLFISILVFGISLLIKEANMLSYISSIFIAPSFLIVFICLYYCVSENKKLWLHIGIVFGVIYSVYAMLNYYIQATVIRLNDFGTPNNILQLFTFKPGSILFAQDMLGYTFLCLATLVSAPAFNADKSEKILKWFFIIHGMMFIIPLSFPAISFKGDESGDIIQILANLFWCVVFIPITFLIYRYFNKKSKMANS
jgi:hypothetical protein